MPVLSSSPSASLVRPLAPSSLQLTPCLPLGPPVDPACNPLKHRYDACFIKWIEGYLEPPSSPSGAAGGKAAAVDQQARAKAKADEYEQLCGESWRAYSSCVWVRPFFLPARA